MRELVSDWVGKREEMIVREKTYDRIQSSGWVGEKMRENAFDRIPRARF